MRRRGRGRWRARQVQVLSQGPVVRAGAFERQRGRNFSHVQPGHGHAVQLQTWKRGRMRTTPLSPLGVMRVPTRLLRALSGLAGWWEPFNPQKCPSMGSEEIGSGQRRLGLRPLQRNVPEGESWDAEPRA